MSFKVTLPRLPKLDVWGDGDYAVQIVPDSSSHPVVLITNGAAAVAVSCSGKIDSTEYVNKFSVAKKTGQRNIQIKSDNKAEPTVKTYEDKEGTHSEVMANAYRAVDILNSFPILTGSPVAAVEVNVQQLLDITKAMGVGKDQNVRLVFGIKQVPFVQHGLAELVEWNTPLKEDLLREMVGVRKDIEGRASSGQSTQCVTMRYDESGWRLDSSCWFAGDSTAFRNHYVIRFSGETDEQIADMLIAEYKLRQMDRQIAIPNGRQAVLVCHPSGGVGSMGCFMPKMSRDSPEGVSNVIRAINAHIQALKDIKRKLDDESSKDDRPF